MKNGIGMGKTRVSVFYFFFNKFINTEIKRRERSQIYIGQFF